MIDEGRRGFIKRTAMYLVAVAIPDAVLRIAETLNKTELEEDCKRLKEVIKKDFGVDIFYDKSDIDTALRKLFSNYDKSDTLQVQHLLIREMLKDIYATLHKYPPNTFPSLLKRIFIMGKTAPMLWPSGLTLENDKQDVPKDIYIFEPVFLNWMDKIVDRITGFNHPFVTIDHELCHLIHLHHPDLLKNWPKGKVYARPYGASAVQEDIATFAEMLFGHIKVPEKTNLSEGEIVNTRAENRRQIIMQKLNFLRQVYDRVFDLPEDYWQFVRKKHSIDEWQKYWRKYGRNYRA